MNFNSNGMRSGQRAGDCFAPLEALLAPKSITKLGKILFKTVKLTGILILMACLQVSAKTTNAQRLSISLKNGSLKELFAQIEKKTNYTFFYDVTILKNSKPVTIEVKDASVEDILRAALKEQALDFSITNQTIFVKKVVKGVAEAVDGGGPPTGTLKASGVVLNEVGQPLSGASVTVLETRKSTITDARGEFNLPQMPMNGTLIISFIGYEPQRIKISQERKVNIKLKVTTDELDKVVIQGYGETSERLSTGDMVVVTAEEIEKQPVMNPLMALQGRVAGLDIQQTSGYASAPIKAEIRGRSSVDPTQVSDPLYIVDGVPLTVLVIGKTQDYSSGSFGFLQNAGLVGPANGQSPLFSINPSDIESITVLKDADATSIYGSQGANGVILITTKKGKPGKTHLNIHVDEGVNKVTRYWKLLNTPEYLEMRNEAFRNDGIVPNVGNAPDLLLWDTTRYTDWQKTLYGSAGKVINTDVSLSGGDVRTTFRIGTTYTHSTEITSASGADQRASVSFSLTHHSLDQRFVVSMNTTYSFTQSNMITLPGSIAFAPDAPAIFDSSGKINWTPWDAAGGPGSNPFGVLLQPYSAKTNFLNSNLIFSFQPFRGLNFKTSLGYNNAQANQTSLISIASQDPSSQPTGSSELGNNSNKNWIIEPQISYDLSIGSGKLNALVGGSAQETITDGIYISGTGYTSDVLLQSIASAPYQFTAENYGEYRYASLFGRISYNLENKYIINFNARRDGSSNYGPGNQFGNFSSIGAGWIFTEENWFKRHLSFLSFGKLRGSYGTTGSNGGKPYGYITRWSANNLLAYDDVQSLVATQHANPDYHWQVNRKLEGGLDMGFFKDWITIRISYYRNRTNNQLLSYPTPLLSGFGSVIANLPALVQNSGWEYTIGGKGIHTKYFSWAPNFNFSINQNKFISFPGLGSSPYRNNGLIGQPLNGLYLLHYTGVDPQTGQYTYQDRNHDGVINPNYGPTGDVYFKKISPSFATGFGFNFDFKSFNLALFFSVKKQTGINAIAQGTSPGHFNAYFANQPVEVLARWQKPGDITNTAKFSTIGAADPNGYLSSSDIGYTDASYVRLQNFSLSYNFPESYVKKAGMQSFNLFVHANNIFVITKYKGIDPETQNFGGLPPTRTIVGGLSVNF